MSDVYYSPEKFGLEQIYDYDCADSYEFDLLVLWKNKQTGDVLMGEDSG